MALAYVANSSANTVSVIDTVSNTVVTNIAVATDPFGVAITPDNLHVYVTIQGSNEVQVISTASNTVVATISAGSAPDGLCVSPDGSHVYLADAGAGTVTVIATSTNTVVATISITGGSVGITNPYIRCTPDGLHLYTTVNGIVSVISTASNTVVATVSGITSGFGLAITPDGSTVLVTTFHTNTVAVIATASNTVVGTVTATNDATDVVIDPGGVYAYVTLDSPDNAIGKINITSQSQVATIRSGLGPECIAITADGLFVYATNYTDGTVSVISTASFSVIATVTTGASATGIAITTTATRYGFVPSLPIFDLYVGFYQFNGSTEPLIEYASAFPLPASGASNTQWTNASAYLLTHSLAYGKQHYLDQAQPATATMTLNARDGFFFNGAVNGQGVTLRRQMPIAITATQGGTTYPVFVGYIQQVHEQPIDVVNDVITVDAVDFTGLLAVTSATKPNLYGAYAKSGNAQHWYRLGVPQTVNIVAAFNYVPAWIYGITFTTGQVLYVVSGGNSLTVGETVTSSGLVGTGTNTNSLCYSNMLITQVTGQYVVATVVFGSVPGGSVSSQGTGTIYNTTIYDQIGSTNGLYSGIVSWPNQGALVYDTDSCVDLGAGGYGTSSGYILSPITAASGVECWVLGLNTAGQTIISMSNGGSRVTLTIALDGTLEMFVGATVYHGSTIPITDGYWHHVGIFYIGSTVYIYCDGVFTATAYSMSGTTFGPDGFTSTFIIGGSGASLGTTLGAYVDEAIFSGYGVTEGEVQFRYVVGHLCQTTKHSGDRIAELLFIAGFGSVDIYTLGITTPTNFLQIGSSYGSTVDYNSVAGSAGNSQVEPYYWDTPITGSMILDLINQVTSTDYGVFLELQNGEFAFFDQGWFGAWSYTENAATQTPSSYSWTPDSSAWAGAPVLADDNSGIAYVTSSLDVLSDGSDQYTLVDVDPQAGQRQVIELSTANTALYGSTTLQVSSNLPTSLEQARSLGWYLGYLFRPTLYRRVDSVQTGTEQGDGANNATLLNLFIWNVVFFKRTPPNASTSGTDIGQINYAMAIESLKMDFDSEAGYVHWTFGLSPYEVGAGGGVITSPTSTYVANASAATITVISGLTQAVVATISTATDAFGVALSPDGSSLWLTNQSGDVYRYATSTNSLVATVSGLSLVPDGICVTPDGLHVYVAGAGGAVFVISTASNSLIATISISAGSPYSTNSYIRCTPDGLHVYTTVNGVVSVISTASNTVVATVSGITSGFGLAITPDGSKVLVTTFHTNTVAVIATASNTVVGTVTGATNSTDVCIDPAGTYAYVTLDSPTNQVGKINISTGSIVATVATGAGAECISITSDGLFVYATNYTDGTATVIATSTFTVAATVTCGGSATGVAST